jgi:hypothetical protein
MSTISNVDRVGQLEYHFPLSFLSFLIVPLLNSLTADIENLFYRQCFKFLHDYIPVELFYRCPLSVQKRLPTQCEIFSPRPPEVSLK